MRLNRARREGLEQRLSREIAAIIDIYGKSGTQYTEWVESAEFLGIIALFANNNYKSAKEAMRYRDSYDEMSFWTDRSRLDSGTIGASVACRKTQ